MHNPLALTAEEAAIIPDLDAKMDQHGRATNDWFAYWDKFYEDRGVAPEDFLRQSCESSTHICATIVH